MAAQPSRSQHSMDGPRGAAIQEMGEASPTSPAGAFHGSGVAMNQTGSGNTQQYASHGDFYSSGGGPQFIAHQIVVNEPPKDEKDKKEKQTSCLHALYLTDPMEDRHKLVNTKGSRVNGTCEWIKANPLYESWLHSHSQLLWISGGPGMGKSMIAIFLAEELEPRAKDPHTTFLQYFCDNKDERRNTAVTVLRGLIFQILQLQPKLFHHILPSFEVKKESMFTFETLWTIFQSMICEPILEDIYCVLDGLDECDEESLEMLLKKFADLLLTEGDGSPACQLKLIVLSRDFPDFIPHILSCFPRIRLDPDARTEVNGDIYRFIDAKIGELSAYRNYPGPLILHVKKVFLSRAQGTFLWIGIVAKALAKCKATEVEKALDLFPAGLDGVYARILLQIEENRREMAARILRWVVMAFRPLTLSELSIALEDAIGTSVVFSRYEIMKDCVEYCGYFLTIKDDEVNLVHQSAKDYLLRNTPDSDPQLEGFRVKEYAANLEIARRCFYYLQNGSVAAVSIDLERKNSHPKAFPLLSYAARYWHEHSRTLACSEDIFDLSLPFYNEKSEVRESWLNTCLASVRYFHEPASSNLLHLASSFGILPLVQNLLLKPNFINMATHLLELNKVDYCGRTPLILAAEYGYDAVALLLVEQGANVEVEDNDGMTALMRTAGAGHEKVVRLLLENGADVEARDNDGWTALILAAEGGHEVVVQLLLEKGAKVEAKDSGGWTAMILAAKKGHDAVVQLLLEKGANVEFKDIDGNTALAMAAFDGREVVVLLLLERGADIEAKDNRGSTPLIQAAWLGHKAMVQLLLEKGAYIKAKNNNGDTALILAAQEGHGAVAQLLLEKGANIEAKNNDGKTALIWAARNGHEVVVRLLLEKGANIEAKNNGGYTPLIWAAGNGHDAVVQLLLEKGADVEAKENCGYTALHFAFEGGLNGVVQLLLEKGGDIESKDIYGKTLLIEAAENGHEAVVLLLEKGANIEAKDDYGYTALIGAAFEGHKAVVQLLLEKGANIEAKNNSGWTALIWAAGNGYEAVVQQLLEKGANIEAKNNGGYTPLIQAAFNRHEAVVLLLLEKGANIEAKDNYGWTALILAAEYGYEAMVRLLLEKGADVEAKDNEGMTALIKAARRGHDAVVRLLLEKGGDVDDKNNDRDTPLIWAAWKGHEAVVQLLLEKGADVEDKNNYGKKPLILAALEGHGAVVRLLLEKGANVEAKDNNGETALIWAARKGHEGVVRLLLEKGANVEAEDNYGNTALKRAFQSGHARVVRLLILYLNS